MCSKVNELRNKYPVIAVTGPRQSGKSTLVKKLFPGHKYINLENPALREFALSDPQAFIKKYNHKIIFDEVQYAPLLLSYVQEIVDERKEMGDFIITGSSQFKLREAITQSLAGRVSIFQLLPLSISEWKTLDGPSTDFNKSSFESVAAQGLYPAIYDRHIKPQDFYADYLQTYVERDVRSLINVKDLRTFQLFLKMCAGRVGSIINFTSLGNDLGISRETVKSWLNVLEASYIVYLLPPYYANINKRLTKSPKLYFYDTGLLCFLLGADESSLIAHPSRGGIFENFIINEFYKRRLNHHQIPEFYFYAEQSGREVDLVIPHKGKLIGIELKSAATFQSEFTKNLTEWKKIFPKQVKQSYVIYNGESQERSDIEVVSWRDLALIDI